MHIFYTPAVCGEEYILPLEESKHGIKVLRLGTGDEVLLVDGRGGLYRGVIKQPDPKGCLVSIVDKKEAYEKSPYYLHLAVAPTKNSDRIEWMLEKCTEIGINEISILNTEHSERRSIRLDRMEKVTIAAMKQSLKAYLPKLNPMLDFSSFIASCRGEQKFIAHCHPGEKRRLDEVYKENSDAVILIGPEGDFSEEEVKMALNAGFIPVTLGKSRLRTETAGIVACHSIHFINKR